MKILVTGGRNFGRVPNGTPEHKREAAEEYANWQRLFFAAKMDELLNVSEDNKLGDDCTIIHGGAKGADTLAKDYAICNWKTERAYPVTPKDWKEYGNYAGIRRNGLMYDDAQPDVVLAMPGGKGTAHMRDYTKKHGGKLIWFANSDVSAFIRASKEAAA